MKRLALLILLLCHGSLFAANHYIRQGAAGTASGNDWTNAYTDVPASLTRGDVYYIADGASYSSYTFDDGASGTNTITLQKAVIADHGTSTGWMDSYGDGQAIFGSWNVQTDYYIFNGVTRNSDWYLGEIDEYGIRVKCTGDCKPLRIDNGSGAAGSDNTSFRYIDFEGGGRDTMDSNSDIVYTLYGSTNITFQYCALHDSNRTIFLTRDTPTNWVLDHNYIARNASSADIHGEMWSLTEASNITFSYNMIVDTEGTSCGMAGINNGDWNGALIYGNVWFTTPAYVMAGREGCSTVVGVYDDGSQHNTASNIIVQNNSFIRTPVSLEIMHIENSPLGGNIFRNNIMYDVGQGSSPDIGSTTNFGTVANQWQFSTVGVGGTGLQTCTVSCDIFVNITTGNIRLTTGTTAGTGLASPYDIDPDGVTRAIDGIWDRGAFEFNSGGDVTPPTVDVFSPLDGATGVSVTTNLVMNMSELIFAVTAKNITLKTTVGDTTIETIACDNAGLVGISGAVVTINPATTLANSTGYYVLIDAGCVEDASGNDFAGIASSTTWNFTTIAGGGGGGSSSTGSGPGAARLKLRR